MSKANGADDRTKEKKLSFHKIAPVKKAEKPAPKPAPKQKTPKKPQPKRPVGHR
ncbi:hypothetical protein ABTY98_28000 [Streptomyces sp. NPDC096040]|uniref:hypothetical protein n=1 Tax=Streptomyces sp. NPDC096040 TaxID=3155541 RepID=UPI003327C924